MNISAKPVDPRDYQDLYPFQSHFIDRGGLCYHYLDQGHGDPVVMVHGNPTWSFYFRQMIQALSGTHRTIAPDHMGCGLSDKPDDRQYNFSLESRVADFGALMDHLGLDRVTLMVHDWGGMIGMAWAVAHPQRVARLIVTNTAAFFPPGSKGIPLRLWLIRNLKHLSTPAVLYGNLFARGALYMAPHKRLSADVKRGLLAPYNSPQNRLATLRFVQDIPLLPGDPGFDIVDRTQRQLSGLRQRPMLILWGRHDFVFDLDYYQAWCRRFPDAENHLFDDAGHYLLEDVPERIASLIKDFLVRHPV
ncbi:alpha/beta hydrolase [Desulfosarcina ovata subsp. sediminis]|uniref:Alpha/beta hydrolase n=1 Tax=Desulfosarcina ovata subsp. sediminis TaxID=885957 RepID=A0A5K7ZJ91_9BACT|nr:alpha/beta fold hydrolase [Desulfosarcina ovata]BBO80037.1 alpha/beta hydrolase [Desulfosarcina ovata subsp. sediminis]